MRIIVLLECIYSLNLLQNKRMLSCGYEEVFLQFPVNCKTISVSAKEIWSTCAPWRTCFFTW